MALYDENLLKSEETKIKDCYAKIGERYYAAHKDDDNAEFPELISAVKASEKAIEDHKEAVRKAEEQERIERRNKELLEKELMLCPNCGAEIYFKSIFCNFCGFRVVAEQPIASEPVTAEPAVEEPAVEEPAVEEPAVEEPAVEEPVFVAPPTKEYNSDDKAPVQPANKICSKCGAVLDDECVFCTECGAPVEADAAPAPVYNQAPISDSVRFCTECGFKVTDTEAVFCNSCGSRLPTADVNASVANAPVGKTCPSCGFTTTDPEILFCIECGHKLS